MSKPTKIILNRQSDLVLNNATIVTPTGIVKSDIPELVSDLGGLRTDVNLVTDKVDMILEGATASLDQFREVVAFVNNIDTENQNSLISIYASMSSAYSGLSASLNQIITDLPDADGTTLEVDGENLIRLKDTVAPGIGGVRTFEGDNKAGVQPDTLDSYDELSFVTKGILDDAIRANIKDWASTSFRFADDDVLQMFGFPQTLEFMQFVSYFYGSYDGYDGNYAAYLQNQFAQGNFGQESVRKNQVIDAISNLGGISLSSEVINLAISGDTTAFNKIYQIEKYYETVEIAIERFNEAVMKAHMLEEARANIKDWASTSFRFAEDDVLQMFGFPQTLEFMQFVSYFYGSYDGYDGNFASYLQNQFGQGNFGQESVRKNQVIDAIVNLGSISLSSEVINLAISGNVEAFNKIYQLEKYYEKVEIAIERFNEAIMKAHMLEEVRANIKDWASTTFRFAEDEVLQMFGFPQTLEFMQFVSYFYGSYDGYDGNFANYLQNQFSQGNFGQESVRKNQVIEAIMNLGSISLSSDVINLAINGNVEAFNKIYQLEKYYEKVEIAIERFNEAVNNAHMLEEARANIKDWASTTFRFAEDDVLQMFGFPQTLEFMQFVSYFYGSYDGYDGNFANYLQNQFGQGNFGQESVRKNHVIDAIMSLGSISLSSEVINLAINGNVEAFNKIYQLEKYYEKVEIAIERFNEAVMKAHMLEEVRANIKEWSEVTLRFTEDSTLASFGFPQTITFIEFVKQFYNDGLGSYIESQYYSGAFGEQNQRKQSLVNAILGLDDTSLSSEVINHAANSNVESFNKIYQIEKYYEKVEIAIERFNEAVISVQLQLQIDNLSTQIDTNINTNIDALESNLQTEINNRISGDAYLQQEIDLLPLTDGDTIEVDLAGNFVRLKEVVAAPDSGVRTFEGDIKVSEQPDTKGSYNDYSLITKGVMDSRLSGEVSTLNSTIDQRDQRAIEAEANLQSQIDTERVRIDNILEGSDVNLDQFREVVDFVNGVVANNPDSIYNQISQVNIELDAETAERLRLTNLLGDGLEQEVIDREDGDAFIQHQIDILPLTDGDTIEVDQFNNYVRLKDYVSVNPELGYRVFEGDLKISSENSDLPSFNDLSLVTKKYSDTSRNALNNLIVQEVDRAMSSEAAIVDALDSVENRVDDVEATIAGLPSADNLSIEVNSSNSISLKDSISAGSEGIRTFGGVLNADAEPSLDPNFGELTYVTKGFVESLSTNVGDDLAAEIARATAAEAAISATLTESIASEASRATAAEEALASDLASEASRATAAEEALAADLASETSRATAAEEALAADLASEASRAQAIEAGLQSSIDAILAGSTTDLDNFREVVDFVNSIDLANDNSLIAAVATFSAALSAEESRAMAAEATLTSDLASEVSRATAAEAALSATFSAAIAAEISRATAAEAALTSDLASEVSRATAAEEALASDLASEISRATAAESALSSDLASETSRALAAEAALSATFSAAIAAERSRAQLVENEIYATFSSSIAAEVSRATAAEAQLSADLDNLQTYVDTTVDSAIATLTADLAAETTARIEAESALQNNINAEANERAAEDITLQSNINTEAARAQAAESAIASDLATETAARIAADATLSSDLASETSRAQAAEAELQSSIDAILAGSTTDLNSFREVVDFVNSIDMTNDNNLIAAVATFSVALSAEESRAIAAEAALSATFSAAIAAEVSRATAAEAALTSALSAEEAARIAGDTTLQASLDNEITDRIAAVQSLQSSLTSESTRAIAAEAALSATFSIAIAAEISRATAAEAALSATFSAAIAAEISRATAAEATLTSDLASEVSRAEAAEAAIVADFNNIYSKKVSVIGTPNGTLTSFSLAKPVRIGSEMVYLNGLLMEEGEDYTTTISSGKVSGIEFISAPLTDMKVLAYGVCGI